MTIDIENPDMLIEQAGAVAQLNNNILRVEEDLQVATSRIRNAWESDTADKDAYLQQIETNLTKIETLCAALRALSNNLIVYANQQKANAQSTN